MPTERIQPELITSIYEKRSSPRFLERTKVHINNETLRLITNIGEDMRARIGELLKEGEEAGRSVAATASKLLSTGLDQGVFRSARKRAWLIAKTELHRARQQAALDIYRDAGIKRVRWVGIPDDGRICPECREKHGDVYSLDEIVERPPIHPRCRCRLLPLEIDLQIRPPRITPKGKVVETKITVPPSKLKYIVRLNKTPRPKKVRKSVEMPPFTPLAPPESYESEYVRSQGYELAKMVYLAGNEKKAAFDAIVGPFTKNAIFKSQVRTVDSILGEVLEKRAKIPKFGVLSLDDHVYGDLVATNWSKLPNIIRGLTKAGFNFGIYLDKTNTKGANGIFATINLGDGINGKLTINTSETLKKSDWSGIPDDVKLAVDQARLVKDKFLVDLIKSRRNLVDVRKSRVRGKLIPQKIDGKLVWTKALGDDLVREVKGGENAKVGDQILIKGLVGRVTGIGRDGVTARLHGKKYQILHEDVRLLKLVGGA